MQTLRPKKYASGFWSLPNSSLQDDIGVTEVEPFRSKMIRAVKYTCVLVAIFVVLVVVGYFIPADDNLPPNNGTQSQDSEAENFEAEYEFQRPRRVKSENILGSVEQSLPFLIEL